MLICQAIEENVEKKACLWNFKGDTSCKNDQIEDHVIFIKNLTMGNG